MLSEVSEPWPTVKMNSPSGPDDTPTFLTPGRRPTWRLNVAMLATLTSPTTTTWVDSIGAGLAGASSGGAAGSGAGAEGSAAGADADGAGTGIGIDSHDLLTARPQVCRDAAAFALIEGWRIGHLGGHAGEDRGVGLLEELLEEAGDLFFEGRDALLHALDLELDRGVVLLELLLE